MQHRTPSHSPEALSRKQRSPEVRSRRQFRVADRQLLAADRAGAVLAAGGLLRLPEVLAIVPVSATTWWHGIRESRFPHPVRISPRCVAWRANDIRELLVALSGSP